MRRLEALADAMMHYSGYGNPDSAAYRTRNPGLLKAFSQRHPRNDEGHRVFRSFVDGYQALLYDLEIKCAGKSRSKLAPDSTLVDLMRAYGLPDTQASFVAKYLKKALLDESVSAVQPLSYFNEGEL